MKCELLQQERLQQQGEALCLLYLLRKHIVIPSALKNTSGSFSQSLYSLRMRLGRKLGF